MKQRGQNRNSFRTFYFGRPHASQFRGDKERPPSERTPPRTRTAACVLQPAPGYVILTLPVSRRGAPGLGPGFS